MRRFAPKYKVLHQLSKYEIEQLREDQKIWRDNKKIDREVKIRKRLEQKSSPKVILRKSCRSTPRCAHSMTAQEFSA